MVQGNSVAEKPVEKLIFSLSDKIAIADCVLTGILLLVTIISVICAFKAYKHQKNRAKKDAACELAKYYARHIIDEFQFVFDVLALSQLNDKIENLFPYDDISALDRKELNELLKKAEKSFDDVEQEMDLVDPLSIYNAKILNAKSIAERQLIAMEYIVVTPTEEGAPPVVGIAHANLLQNEFGRAITALLNNLEYFAMGCQYGLADEEMLYQPLHQTYISQVQLLYFYICRNNITNEDKVYTSLIWLFNLWKNRLKGIQEAALSQRAEANKRLNSLTEQLQEAKEEVDHIEPEIYTGTALR